MFNLPYETRRGQSYALKATIQEIQKAMSQGELTQAVTQSGKTLRQIVEIPPYLKSVPQFGHPLFVDHFGDKKMVIDTRPFVRSTKPGEPRVITNRPEYNLMVLRALMTQAWIRENGGGRYDFSIHSDFPARVFIRLVSEGLVRRLGLTPADQFQIVSLVGHYFFSQFYLPGQFEESDRIAIASKINRATTVPVEKVLEFTEDLKQPTSLSDLVESIRTRVSNPRVEKFNEGLFYSLFTGYWYGANAREIVAVSFEHVPTFYALVYTALTERSYHGSALNKLVQQIDRKDAGKEFVRHLTAFIERVINE